MRASRKLLSILFALMSVAPMLHAASDPRGTYNGTLTWTYTYGESGQHRNTSEPLVMTVADGPSPGSYRVELRATANSAAWKVWDPAGNSTVHESWTATSFELTQTSGNHSYKLSGAISGSQLSGTYADNYNDTLMMGCQFSATRSGGGFFGGGSTGSAAGSTGQSSGHMVHTGPGNDEDDYTWVSGDAPLGISGVNGVPGPADLPESGTGILLPGLLTALGVGLKSMLDSSVTPPPMVDYGSSDSGAQDASAATDQSAPAAPEPPDPGYGPDYTKAMQDAQDASDKYNAMKQQLADFEKGADTSDPQYAVLKQQYADYLNYYKQKADDSSASADGIAKAVEQERNTRVLKDFQGNDVKQVVYDPATGQWHDSETGNLFDPDKWQQVQDQASKDAAWAASDLNKMAAHQDSFSKNLDQIGIDEKHKEAELNYLGKLQKMAFDANLTDPGGAHDVFVTTQNMMNDIMDGKTVTVPTILATRQFLHDSLLGNAAPESILSLPENQANLSDIATSAAWNSMHELITGKDSDGHFTVAGVIGSIGLHVAGGAIAGPAYGWVSEGLLTAANTVYAEKNAIDHGATGWGALGAGALEAVSQGGVQAAGGLAMHYVPIHCPNVAAGIGEMMQPVTQIGKRISNAMFPLSESQQITRNAVEKALASDNPADLVGLYKNGGMAKLGELQASGNLTKAEAMALNSKLAPIVNTEIDKSTRLAMQQFQSRTGVKIEQSIIADSGSGARGGPSSKAFTDFDRTQVTRFNQEDLAQYARDHSISVEEANQKLQSLYGNQLTNNLDTHLRGQGFTKGTNDIHYSTYNGIGEGSGPCDSYGAGWTGQRNKLQGAGLEYNNDQAGNLIKSFDADGNPIYSRKITGTAVVDQHGLNVHQVTGELPPNPDKFSTDEFQSFSRQQVNAANGHMDVKSVAKAMKRESDLADRVTRMSGNNYGQEQLRSAGIPTDAPVLDPKLNAISKQIADNPSQADSILASNKMTPIEYQAQVKTAIENYHAAIGGTSR